MYSFIETLKNIWKISELRDRIFITLFFLAIYRLGAQVVLPGIDSVQLAELSSRTQGGGLLGILNAFTGGAFANASVFALGIMPYISASIVVQLMGIAVPYLQKLQKEGESGRKTINQITRWLTILICVVQAPAYLYSLGALGVPESALTIQGDTAFVYVVTNEVAEKRNVVIGKRNFGKVSIVSGVSEGDLIISEGVSKARNKAKVKIIKPKN